MQRKQRKTKQDVYKRGRQIPICRTDGNSELLVNLVVSHYNYCEVMI